MKLKLPWDLRLGLLGFVAIALATATYVGYRCSTCRVTRAKYEAIAPGSTRAQVEEIMGFAGVEDSAVMPNGEFTTLVVWRNFGDGEIRCTFGPTGFLRTKRQVGLSP